MKKLTPIAQALKTECVLYDLADASYRMAPGISQSQLKVLAISPADFQLSLKQPVEPTPAMIFGRIAHHVLLTPKALPFWVVKPEGLNLNSVEGKAWKQANAGRVRIDLATMGEIINICAKLNADETVKLALTGAKREVSWFAYYKAGKSKVRRKGRIDVVPKGPALIDFKFVEDARQPAFDRFVKDQKHHIQAAYYLDGYNALMPGDQKSAFVFIAVEKTPPYHVQFYELDTADIEDGRTEYRRLLATYIECRKTDTWPEHSEQYPEGVRKLKLRRWGKNPAQDGDLIIQ